MTDLLDIKANDSHLTISIKVDEVKKLLCISDSEEEKKELPLKDKVIVLDPGHGKTHSGFDYGAWNIEEEIREHDVNMIQVETAAMEMRKLGAKVYIIPTKTGAWSLGARYRYAETQRADFFISVHTNAYIKQHVQGTETFGAPDKKSKHLAECLQTSMVNKLGLSDRGTKDGSWLGVLKSKEVPSALTEFCFLTHYGATKTWIENQAVQAGRAICEGVVKAVTT